MIRKEGTGLSEVRQAAGQAASPFAAEIAMIRRRRRLFALALALAGMCTLAALAAHGGRYYLAHPADRLAFPNDRALRPSGIWGHGVGIVATLIMCANFLYPLRKRMRWMQRTGPVPLWLTFHVFVGLMTPPVILFHAAFRLNNLIATFTYASLLVVMTTGLVGRYIYALVPGSGGLRSGELADLEARWRELTTEIRAAHAAQGAHGTHADPSHTDKAREQSRHPDAELPAEEDAPAWLASMLRPPVPARHSSPARALGAVLAWPGAALAARERVRAFSRRLPREQAVRVRAAVKQMVRLRLQIEFFGGIKRLLATWRFGHSLLALFLVLVILIHVAVSVAFGYRWIF